MSQENNSELVELAGKIVASYVGSNTIAADALPGLISTVYGALKGVNAPPAPEEPKEVVPAVPVKRSVFPDYIVCLEDGKKFKSLKRHLRTSYNLTPEQYRVKFGLAPDYPMVAPNYAAQRSELAKKIGLGRGRKA